jgi:putative transposase
MSKKAGTDFYEGGIFHVYNRTNNREPLFKNEDNKLFFLRQYAKYLNPFLDTFCWNLLPNHFHFLIRVKSTREIHNYLNGLASLQIKGKSPSLKPVEKQFLQNETTMENLLTTEWTRFFTSYAMAFNKQHDRTGNLFQRPFKRVEVAKDAHFTQTVVYIHANAQKHKICQSFEDYQWSSWHSIISSKPTQLLRSEVLEWFGGREQCIEAHRALTDYYYSTDLGMDDE